MRACFCLNIIIDASNDIQKIMPESLELTDEEKNDPFFKMELHKGLNVMCITKVHPCLVKERIVGCWIIYQCLNCDCNTHAILQRRGPPNIVINSKLLDKQGVISVKSSDIYSPIYNIVVNPNDAGIEDKPLSDSFRYSLPANNDPAFKSVRNIMTEYISKQSRETEVKIQKYTDEQYDLLATLKDRALREHDSLARLLQTVMNSEPTESTNKPVGNNISPVAASSTKSDKPTESSTASTYYWEIPTPPIAFVWNPAIPRKTKPPKRTDSEELIFPFECDELKSEPKTDELESDKEDKEEGISIPKTTTRVRPTMAKSLPMNIPAFITNPKHGQAEEFDDVSPPVGENVDIAASIKALAKSVHGDRVFGDLPRPRFSTQI